MRNDLPPRDRYDELSNAWRPAEERSLLSSSPPPPPRAFRRRFLFAAAVHILIIALVVRSVSKPEETVPPVSMGDWNIEVESAGSSPLTALVYGSESGVHLITVPAEGASAEEKRRMTAKLGKGQVRLISFGTSSLRVKATSPQDAQGATLGARGRVITLFSDATGSGVRTGW